jgi:phosphatidylinositol dimannoside acyltransferase
MQSPAEFMAYFSYSMGWRTVRWMPESVAHATFSQLADQAWRQKGKGVRQLERNLARVAPEASYRQLRTMSREGMQKYFRYWCDVFRLPDWSYRRTVDTFVLENKSTLQAALDEGRGVVASLPHAGNWDHGGAYMALAMDSLVSVAEDLKPERLTTKFLDFRRELGIEVIVLRKGEDVFGQLVDKLAEGKLLALLGDRDLTSRGVPVDFFGEATRFPAGPAALAHTTGAPLFAAHLWCEGEMSFCRVGDRITTDRSLDRTSYVRAATQQIADEMAEGIREHPTDWHMLQPLWLSDLDQSRLRASDYDTPAGSP